MSTEGDVRSVAREISPESIETTNKQTDKIKKFDSVNAIHLDRSGSGENSAGISLQGKSDFQISSSLAATKSNVNVETQRFGQLYEDTIDSSLLDDTDMNTSNECEHIDDRLNFPGRFCNGESAIGNSSNSVVTKCNDSKNIPMYEQFYVDIVDFQSLVETVTNTSTDFENEEDSHNPLDSYLSVKCEHIETNLQDLSIEDELKHIEQARNNIISKINLFMQQIDRALSNYEQKYRADLKLFEKRLQEYMQGIESLGHNLVPKFLIERISSIQRFFNSKLSSIKTRDEPTQTDTEKDFQELGIKCAMPQLEQAYPVIVTKILEKLQQLNQDFPNCEGRYKTELESLQQSIQEYRNNLKISEHNAITEKTLMLINTLQVDVKCRLRHCQLIEEQRLLNPHRTSWV